MRILWGEHVGSPPPRLWAGALRWLGDHMTRLTRLEVDAGDKLGAGLSGGDLGSPPQGSVLSTALLGLPHSMALE